LNLSWTQLKGSLLNNAFTDLKKERLAPSKEHLNLRDRTMKTPKYLMLSTQATEKIQIQVNCTPDTNTRYRFQNVSTKIQDFSYLRYVSSLTLNIPHAGAVSSVTAT